MSRSVRGLTGVFLTILLFCFIILVCSSCSTECVCYDNETHEFVGRFVKSENSCESWYSHPYETPDNKLGEMTCIKLKDMNNKKGGGIK